MSTLEHKTCDILAAELLRLMRFDNRLIIDSFQKGVCILERSEKEQNCNLQNPQADYLPRHSPDFIPPSFAKLDFSQVHKKGTSSLPTSSFQAFILAYVCVPCQAQG